MAQKPIQLVAGKLTPVFPAASISQLVGTAISATEIDTDIDDCIVLA